MQPNYDVKYHHESPEYVQFFLDGLQHMQPFTVIFRKQDGTQRKLANVTLKPEGKSRIENVPVMTEDGQWRSFNINRVLWIGAE
jgi:hypothetical protein